MAAAICDGSAIGLVTSNSKRHFWGYQSWPNLKQIWSVVPESLDRLQPFKIYFLPLVSCHLNQGICSSFPLSSTLTAHAHSPCPCPVQISDDNAKGIGLVTAHSQTASTSKIIRDSIQRSWRLKRLGKVHLVFQEANPLTKQRPRKHSLRLRSWAYLHPPRDLDI